MIAIKSNMERYSPDTVLLTEDKVPGYFNFENSYVCSLMQHVYWAAMCQALF